MKRSLDGLFPRLYKHFAPPGLAPQNPLAPGELNGATLRLCALARMSLLIQSVVLAKAQRRKGRKGKILAGVEFDDHTFRVAVFAPRRFGHASDDITPLQPGGHDSPARLQLFLRHGHSERA